MEGMMTKAEFQFGPKIVNCYFNTAFSKLPGLCPHGKIFIITDNHIRDLYKSLFSHYQVISIESGEISKTQKTADQIIQQLIELEADRNAWIIGVGGGVVTDLAGYVASVYKRGVNLGLVPTSLLAMVDAAPGGKNGVNAGVVKNIIGTIYQPSFILYDLTFLDTLPEQEWHSGFAEIIKHACIRDYIMYETLERFSLHEYRKDKTLLEELVRQNVQLKMKVVQEDETDRGNRLLLNFGHTIGHALENIHELPHGYAVSIGMVAACNLSEKMNRLHFDKALRVVSLLSRYGLPVEIETDVERIAELIRQDKKRDNEQIRFVLLNDIGSAEVVPVDIAFLEANLNAMLC